MYDIINGVKEILSINWSFSFENTNLTDEERIEEIIDELQKMGVWE